MTRSRRLREAQRKQQKVEWRSSALCQASYIGKKVVVAVKAGGDDPNGNLQLAKVLAEANSLNVPKDVIQRNIKKAMDPVTADYKELTYEAYGVGGVGMIINCLSDNNNRATADVNMIVKKNGCNIASSGGCRNARLSPITRRRTLLARRDAPHRTAALIHAGRLRHLQLRAQGQAGAQEGDRRGDAD